MKGGARYTDFPHGWPQDTFSCEHLTLLILDFPQAQSLVAKKGHGGQWEGSSWQVCGVFACPQIGGGWLQGKLHLIRVPHGTGGSMTVRPQRQTS